MSAPIGALTRDIELTKSLYAADAPWTVESVGYFIQSLLQGAFIFAKAKQSRQVARDSLAHLHRYLVALFARPTSKITRKRK